LAWGNDHQLDFVTPGNFPAEARSLKQILQIPAFRINPLGRPQMVQRLYARTLNLGVLPAFAIRDFFANFTSWKDMMYAGEKQL